MSAIFLKRFLKSPFQVASIVPSSKELIRRVSDKMDFSVPRIVAEFGPGEGCHTREILKRMQPDSKLLLFELDRELTEHLKKQFADDQRVIVLNKDCALLDEELKRHNLPHCDYVVSGIPFSILEKGKKREILQNTFQVLAPGAHSAFIIYQVTNELRSRGHCDHFAKAESEYCLRNLPPMYVTKFYKTNGAVKANLRNGYAMNGKRHH